MLHLRKVGLSNIIFRNVTGLRSRAAHTTSDAEVFADDDEESKRVPRFEPVSEEGKVTFRLPDLSEREETFLKQQVRIILTPDCLMQQEPESGKCYFQSPSLKKARYPQFGSFSIEWPKLFRLVIRTKPMPSLGRCSAGLSAANINLTFNYSVKYICPLESQIMAFGSGRKFALQERYRKIKYWRGRVGIL